MTRRLFNEDSMIKEFKAIVTSCRRVEDKFAITLSETAFFPTGGGQEFDKGRLYILPKSVGFEALDESTKDMEKDLEFVEVLDVGEEKEDVIHIISRELEVGVLIFGSIDWNHRFDKMQQHTGEHIVSGIISRRYECKNVGFHLGDDTVTLDFDKVLTREDLDEIELMANEIVRNNVKVQVLYPNKDELENISYRSKIEIKGQVRIVSIPDCDICACCAPHVPYTAMVGLIKLIDVVKHRGGVRLTMVCGMRALIDYQQKSHNTKAISQLLSVREENTALGVEKLNRDYQNLREENFNLREEIVNGEIKEVINASNNSKDSPLILWKENLSGEQGKSMMNLLLEEGFDEVMVFTPAKNDGIQFVAGTLSGDVRYISNELREQFGAKGGGNARMVQGSITGNITGNIDIIIEHIKKVTKV